MHGCIGRCEAVSISVGNLACNTVGNTHSGTWICECGSPAVRRPMFLPPKHFLSLVRRPKRSAPHGIWSVFLTHPRQHLLSPLPRREKVACATPHERPPAESQIPRGETRTITIASQTTAPRNSMATDSSVASEVLAVPAAEGQSRRLAGRYAEDLGNWKAAKDSKRV